MRIIEIPAFWTIVIDFAAWFIIHMGCAVLAQNLPERLFDRNTRFYKTNTWEQNGLFWHRVFRVRFWKDKLPDGAAFFDGGFRKKNLKAHDFTYYSQFVRESRRGELTHWLVMLPAPLFFMWNPFWVGWVMIAYALLANGPCIIAQRYNRPRFQRLIDRSQSI